MKTQIIQLEPHDDVTSACDKIGWGQAGRVLLVWPERGRLFSRRLDLILLQRYCKSLGAQLALVTNDSDVRFHARQIAVPVYRSLRRAQYTHWRVNRRARRAKPAPVLERPEEFRGRTKAQILTSRPDPASAPLPPSGRVILFALGVLALFAVVAVLYPSARVGLTPRITYQETVLEVQAGAVSNPANASGSVPAHPVRVIVEGRDSRPASGSVVIPASPAVGMVQFTNLTDRSIKVAEGTVVRTMGEDPVRFATIRTGILPPGPNETLLLPVKALAAGSKGNLEDNRLTAVEGELGTQVAAANPRRMSGGRDVRTAAPSERDRTRLKAELIASLRETALRELAGLLSPDDLILPDTLELHRILEETSTPADDQPADLLSMSLRVEFEALVVRGEDLRHLANAALDARLPAGTRPIPETLALSVPDTESLPPAEVIRWKMRARRQVLAQLSEAEAIRLLPGLRPAQAAQRLEAALPLDRPPEFETHPAWWPWLPLLPFRISMTQEPLPTGGPTVQ